MLHHNDIYMKIHAEIRNVYHLPFNVVKSYLDLNEVWLAQCYEL